MQKSVAFLDTNNKYEMQKTISFTIALQNSVCRKERDTRRKDICIENYRTPGRNPGKHPKMRIFSWENYYGNGHIKVTSKFNTSPTEIPVTFQEPGKPNLTS